MDSNLTSKWIRKTAILIGLGVFAAAAWGQTGALEGDVKGPDGKPLKDALIRIVRTDIKGNYKVKSDKKGHYFHAGLPLGTYDVFCDIDGKEADMVRGIRLRLGDPMSVNFDLAERAAKAAAMTKAAESGTLTPEQTKEMTPEQRAAMEKNMKERAAALAKNKELNDAYNVGREALQQALTLKNSMGREADPAKKDDLKKQALTQLQAAAGKFEEGTKLDATQNVIFGNLAETYGMMVDVTTGEEQAQAGAKAVEAYKKAIELKPDASEYHNNYGLLLAKLKKGEEAQAELTKAAQIDPPNAGKYYYNLGAVLVNTSQYEPAVEAFKKAIEADPNHADAQYWYATALSSKITADASGKVVAPPGMKEALEKYIQLKPDGQFASAAKELLVTITGSIETKYENPSAPKKGPTTKKK